MSVTTLRRPKPASLQRPVGDVSTAEWVRPSAWLALPDVTGQQKFAGLYLISKDGNFVALSAAGNYTVDWGDGTSTNHNTGTVAYKQYNYADIPNTGESELGYRQVIIQVTPQAGQNLTSFSLQHRHNQTGLNTSYSPLWLDIAINGSNLTSLSIGGTISLSALQRATILNHNDTSLNGLFQNCRSLVSVPLFNTASVTNMSSMFRSCSSLTYVSLFDTASVSDMNNMFSGCVSLVSVPLFNTASVTNMSNMFQNCYLLASVPFFNTASVTNMSSMFQNCYLLASVPFFNTASVTNMSNMFNLSSALISVPLFNTASVTNMSGMFSSCYGLRSVPLFNTASVTNMGSMFSFCSNLVSVPLFNTASVTSMSSMFNGCSSLTTVPLFNTASVTNMSNMFQNCSNLTTSPLFDTASVTSMSGMFSGCSSLATVPAMNATAAAALGTVASGNNISRFDMTNINATISFTSQKLSKAALDDIFTNLLRRTVSTTITISGNYGADTAISKTSCGTTIHSKVVTQANTSNLTVGMRVLGTGISDAVFMNITASANRLDLVGHGFENDTPVIFTSITNTTGILTYTTYYIVNKTTNAFQLSTTPGGSVVSLTNDGSAFMLYPSYITNITTNTSFEMSAPASATGTVTLTARILDTFPAIAKGWTVSG